MNHLINQPAVIIDQGTDTFKSGFSAHNEPHSVFSPIIGHNNYSSLTNDMENESFYVGNEAQYRREVLSLHHPISNGIITNWEYMEKIWDYTFYHELGISSLQDHPVLLTDHPLHLKSNREGMTQIMFETFNASAISIAVQSVLALYASGRTTGIVLDSGESSTYAVPIYEGFTLPHAIRQLDIGGRDITCYLLNISKEQSFNNHHSFDWNSFNFARDEKEKQFYVALDFNEALNTRLSHSLEYIKNDEHSNVTKLKKIQGREFCHPEILFQPHLNGIESEGIHQMIFHSINDCEIELRKQLYQNIVLSGGNTLFPGLNDRLSKELNRMVPNYINEVKVIAFRERKYAAWIGGSFLTSLSTFGSIWVLAEEYNECGSNFIHNKCF